VKLFKNILLIVEILILLSLVSITPWALFGVIVFLMGLYLNRQHQKGTTTFSKSGWVMSLGILLAFIIALSVYEPTEAVKPKVESKAIDKEELALLQAQEKVEEEQKLTEEKSKAEAEKVEKEKQEALEKQQEQEELAKNLNLELITVGRVVDGDTFETSDGRKVRLIGVNTPESTTRVEQFGKDASNYTTSKLSGKQVWMQKDVSETDRYDRYLRIVWLEIPTDDMDESEIRAKMFNADLVLNGYAEPSTYTPDVKYSDYFVKFAREAREANTGLWAFGEDGTTKGDLDSAGNTNKSTSPSTADTSTTTPPSGEAEESYQNCTELRKVHPNGVPSTHPAYDSKHDRDKDNYACER
jgi:micrococcal nuclease